VIYKAGVHKIQPVYAMDSNTTNTICYWWCKHSF